MRAVKGGSGRDKESEEDLERDETRIGEDVGGGNIEDGLEDITRVSIGVKRHL